MSDISITPELNSKKLKDGTQRIQLRITQNKKHRRVATEYSVHEKFWNTEKHEVRKGHPIAGAINAAIREKVNKLMTEVSRADVQDKSISARDLQRKARKEVVGDSFIDYCDKHLKNISNLSTRDKNTSVVTKLKKYLSFRDLLFSELTYEFIQDYRKYLLKDLGNMQSTVSKNLEIIRGIYNEAVNAEMFEPAKDPWKKVKISRPKAQPRAKLTLQDIEKLAIVELKGNMAHARNIFILMFYSRGMRISDALELKWAMIRPDLSRFHYRMNKSDKPIDVLITEPIRKILLQYKSEHTRPSEYVFPFLSHNPRKSAHHKMIESWTTEINDLINQAARLVGIETHISSHVARHSFAEIARELTGNDIYAISQAMGHGSVAITENYFAREQKSGNDKLSQIVAPKTSGD